MAARAKPSRGDLALWHRALQDVRPLAGRPPAPPVADPRPDPETAPAAPPAAPPAGEAGLDARRPVGLDRRSAERLRRGELAIEARLDLHGMTQDEAHRAVAGFIGRAQRDGRRCVLVITGKGKAGGADGWGAGTLRAAVPRWLGEPALRPRILALSEAQPKHGGAGALYVLLRRQRG